MAFVFPNNTNTVEEFAEWYKQNEYPLRPPFADGVYVTDISYSYVLFRQGQFQVELYLVKPNSNTPAHSHPEVENIIMFSSGSAATSQQKLDQFLSFPHVAQADGTHPFFGYMDHKVTDGDSHALYAGPKGAAILSIEKWPEGMTPTSLILNWQGESVGTAHTEQLQSLTSG